MTRTELFPAGHGDDERMLQHCAGDGKARAHVAARHFGYWRATLQATIFRNAPGCLKPSARKLFLCRR